VGIQTLPNHFFTEKTDRCSAFALRGEAKQTPQNRSRSARTDGDGKEEKKETEKIHRSCKKKARKHYKPRRTKKTQINNTLIREDATHKQNMA
jgi:hypothetical protein